MSWNPVECFAVPATLQAFDQSISRLIGLEQLTDSGELFVALSKEQFNRCRRLLAIYGGGIGDPIGRKALSS
ncbi:hypothetical protein [Rhodococcus erythropolis]|uniref:hypothetical protein n=1 Tax=Rhodococcus erythropolis TaxID=1833 RepID=UPI0012913218|nr:hypothetical protein [Rhodococcus erythropolis]MCW2298415.1 hypothetical protein [Rhodococcus erythropolis]MQP36047.1 hypothetical protein [Rhodococcus erythropolis]